MGIATEAGALFDSHPRWRNKALLLDITIERSFLATYSLLHLAMSMCGEAGSDVYVLVKEIAIKGVEHRSEIHSNESKRLVEGTGVARLRRRFPFVLQQGLPFRAYHHLCGGGANGDGDEAGCRIGVGNGGRDKDGAGTGTGWRRENKRGKRTGRGAGRGRRKNERKTRTGMGAGTVTGAGTGAGTGIESEGGEEESSGIRHIRK